ncbi:hypothetical protein DOY81_009097 [Sarcophaga bullata]|nr:hypothetical protein DOY81_009097 [Sarcophaga bullata]
MEEIKKLLEENEDYSDISSNGSDSQDESFIHYFEKFADDVSIFKTFITDLNSNTLASKRRSKERLPTRRPNPNIYNRNALLARENRRKKKIYLETIEKELYLAKKTNRVLIKALRRQIKIGHRLEQEKKYFKGLIGKGTDLLRIDQDSNLPTLSEIEVTKPFSESGSLKSLKLLSAEEMYDLTCYSGNKLEDETESIDVDSASNGTVNNIKNSPFDFHTFPDFFTDFENSNMRPNNGNYIDNLINQALPIVHNKNVIDDVNNDHCYVSKPRGFKMRELNYQTDEYFNLDKICLHGTHGEFCEIFCPTCISNTEFRTPPLQLLNDN